MTGGLVLSVAYKDFFSCIINFSLFCVITLYLGIGIAYMKLQRGARGKEMIPNYSFWSEIPALAKVSLCMMSFNISSIIPYVISQITFNVVSGWLLVHFTYTPGMCFVHWCSGFYTKKLWKDINIKVLIYQYYVLEETDRPGSPQLTIPRID